MFSPENVQLICAWRERARSIMGREYGMCHEVSEFIEQTLGLERACGTYCAQNGDVICCGHFWNILPDGSIFDATADRFEEGYDIRTIPPTDPEFTRYRVEWYSEYNPGDEAYDSNHPREGWTGELDAEAAQRLEKERGSRWWLRQTSGRSSHGAAQVTID